MPKKSLKNYNLDNNVVKDSDKSEKVAVKVEFPGACSGARAVDMISSTTK